MSDTHAHAVARGGRRPREEDGRSGRIGRGRRWSVGRDWAGEAGQDELGRGPKVTAASTRTPRVLTPTPLRAPSPAHMLRGSRTSGAALTYFGSGARLMEGWARICGCPERYGPRIYAPLMDLLKRSRTSPTHNPRHQRNGRLDDRHHSEISGVTPPFCTRICCYHL